jgi:hypothetical protein
MTRRVQRDTRTRQVVDSKQQSLANRRRESDTAPVGLEETTGLSGTSFRNGLTNFLQVFLRPYAPCEDVLERRSQVGEMILGTGCPLRNPEMREARSAM